MTHFFISLLELLLYFRWWIAWGISFLVVTWLLWKILKELETVAFHLVKIFRHLAATRRELLVAAALVFLLSINGCINAEKMVEALAKDSASFCGTATAYGGAGALAIAPAAVPTGGGGYAGFSFCRTNQANSIIYRDEAGNMKIIHGWKDPGVLETPTMAPKTRASIP